MNELWKPRCDAIKYRTELFDVILRQLSDVGLDFRVLVGVARKLMVDKFDEPVGEGWVCKDDPTGEDIEDNCKYMMVYRCVEEGNEKLIKVVIEESFENGFEMWCNIYEKQPVYEYGVLIPARLDIEVVEKRDDKSNKFAEVVRSYWGENG
jgi:hypothetical protein